MCKLSVDCGKLRLRDKHFSHLAKLGEVIDNGEQPLVFDHGFVDVPRQDESEVSKYAAQSHTRNGSQTGQRQRQRARPRPSNTPESFCSGALEEAFGTGFQVLVRHYEALSFEDNNGLWVAVKSSPLGLGGPQANFLIAFPLDPQKDPRGWAFSKLGIRAEPFPLKHTNFPDASICAFTKKSGAWLPSDGMTALIDHYSLWAVKSWHRSLFGWWPGRQIGVGALYRRREFVGREFCGCDSGKRYSDCHQAIDGLVREEHAEMEFRKLFRADYEARFPPTSIIQAAKTKWREMPVMSALIA